MGDVQSVINKDQAFEFPTTDCYGLDFMDFSGQEAKYRRIEKKTLLRSNIKRENEENLSYQPAS